MKKMKFMWVLLATALIVVGAILCFASLARAQGDFRKMLEQRFDAEIHTVEGDFTKIHAELNVYDVSFEPSDDGICRVRVYGDGRIVQSISVKDGTLTLVEQDNRKWYEKIISFGELGMTVYLPAAEYEKLEVKTDTGDVTVSKYLAFGEALVEGDTADVAFSAAVKNALAIRLRTGDLAVQGVQVAGDMRFETTTGDMRLYDLACRDLYITVDTGEVELERAGVSGSVYMTGDTGDLELRDVVAVGEMQIKTDTGDVELEACDASSIDIRTDTGDVTATLLTQKSFDVASGTGDVTFPPTTAPNGNCKVRSDTGDVEIYVKS